MYKTQCLKQIVRHHINALFTRVERDRRNLIEEALHHRKRRLSLLDLRISSLQTWSLIISLIITIANLTSSLAPPGPPSPPSDLLLSPSDWIVAVSFGSSTAAAVSAVSPVSTAAAVSVVCKITRLNLTVKRDNCINENKSHLSRGFARRTSSSEHRCCQRRWETAMGWRDSGQHEDPDRFYSSSPTKDGSL